MPELGTTRVARLARRIDQILHRRRTAARLTDEVRFHLDCEIEDRMRAGLTREQATIEAHRAFGGVAQHMEDARDHRGIPSLEELARDTRHATRVLRRNPGFTAAVVLTFALGIGCTSAIFSLVYGILMKPLPYHAPAELVTLWERNDARKGRQNVSSVPTFEAWRSRARSFSAVAALVPDPLTLDGAPSVRLKGVQVSPGYFTMLGVRPAFGRDFAPSDEANGGAPVAILSDGLWRTRYGGEPSIVGRTISIDEKPVTVVGIMGADFDPPRFGWIADQPLWLPFAATEDNRKWGRFLHVVARLRPNVSLNAANAELASLSASIVAEHPEDKGWSTMALPVDQQILGDVRMPILVLFAAVAFLLTMSAVNVASLVATFAIARRHELVVRRTMGASLSRLVRQQLVQSLALGLIGTALGLGLAIVATTGLRALLPTSIPRLANVRVNGAVIAFSSAVALLTILICGATAAWRATGGSRGDALGANIGARTTARTGGSLIVGAEVAIGVVLAVLAALMVRSFDNLRSVNLGFDAGSLVAGRVTLPSARYASNAQQQAFFDALLARVRSTPGVTAASLVTSRPFACCAPATAVHDPTQPETIEKSPVADVRFVDDTYFSAMRIPVLSGHVFSSTEATTGEVRAVITRSLAKTLWGDADAIGKTIATGMFDNTVARVIGIVGDVHLVDARTPTRPTVYVSTRRFPSNERDVVVRGTGDAANVLMLLRRAVIATDPLVPVYMASTFESSIIETLSQDRATTTLLSGFAVLALVLATIGVYGVAAGDVGRRRKEIGIRLALGARTRSIGALVLGRAIRPAIVGALVGAALALTLARLMATLVFGVAPWDPLSFGSVSLSLVGVAVLATMIPALRAARVSPVETIRAD